MRTIIGISAYFHDSAAALVVDGKIIAAAQEERFNRKKNTSDFPSAALRYCLEEGNISLHEVDAIVYFDKPFLKFERLLETYYTNVPKGIFSFIKAMPQWLSKKLFLRREIKKELKEIDPTYKKQKKLLFSSHHLSHAASAFYPSPFDEAAILVIDAVGEWSTATIGKGKDADVELLCEMNFPNSVGLVYSSFTYFLGFEVDSGEYKLMGLSPYGNRQSSQTNHFIEIIKNQLIEIFDDGSIQINRSYFSFEYGLKMIRENKWKELFGMSRRRPSEEIEQIHCNLAFAIQQVTEEIIIKMAQKAKAVTGCGNLCLAGGVVLNCVANGKIHDLDIFNNIWVQPAAGDAGGALGAGLAYYYNQNRERQITEQSKDGMNGAFLGPQILPADIDSFIQQQKLTPRIFSNSKERDEFIINEIILGKVVGLIQGRMEYGPRALGGRSIIAHPSAQDMQQQLNLAIKKREDFRPFAPVMLREEAAKYYDCHYSSAYMQYVKQLNPAHRIALPENYEDLPIKEKLETARSKMQATVHVDYSSRLQVVDDSDHPFYGLLKEMRHQSGVGILVNTSFNKNGEPIVNTIGDAYQLYLNSNMDILVIENHVFTK